jgi:nitrous oxide reductase accessory protein NosL
MTFFYFYHTIQWKILINILGSALELVCKECHARVSSEQASPKLIDMDATCGYCNQESMQVFATETPKCPKCHPAQFQEKERRSFGTTMAALKRNGYFLDCPVW